MEEKITSRARQVLPKIKALTIGESVSFPIEWMDTVRAQTSKCNALSGGKRVTRLATDERLIYVDRKE